MWKCSNYILKKNLFHICLEMYQCLKAPNWCRHVGVGTTGAVMLVQAPLVQECCMIHEGECRTKACWHMHMNVEVHAKLSKPTTLVSLQCWYRNYWCKNVGTITAIT